MSGAGVRFQILGMLKMKKAREYTYCEFEEVSFFSLTEEMLMIALSSLDAYGVDSTPHSLANSPAE